MAENYLETFKSSIEKIKKEREEKVKKGEIIQPLDVPQIDVLPNDPDPDIDDNKQMKQLNERWARDAKRRFPDDETKQKEFIEAQRKKIEIQKEYLTQVVGGVFDAGNSALNFTVNRFLDEDSKILLPEIEAPKSTPQALVRGGAQFMIPYLGWFKLIKGATIGAKLIKAKKGSRLSFKQDLAIATAAGAIADVVHFEANDPTLSKLIDTGESKSLAAKDSFTISSIAASHSGTSAIVLYLVTRSASFLIPPSMSIY